MSVELFVLFATSPGPTFTQWKQASVSAAVPLEFYVEAKLSTHTGFLPVKVSGHETGIFFGIQSVADLAAHFPLITKRTPEPKTVYSIAYGSDLYECAAAFYSAAALVHSYGGIALEPQGGAFMSEPDLTGAAKQCESMAASGIAP